MEVISERVDHLSNLAENSQDENLVKSKEQEIDEVDQVESEVKQVEGEVDQVAGGVDQVEGEVDQEEDEVDQVEGKIVHPRLEAKNEIKKSEVQSEKQEHLYKILVIGELGCGKTSIIKRYVHQFFSQHYRATIGVDFALKVISWDPNTVIRLQLWDIAGQERFGNMTRVYYKEAVGALIVFDVTRSQTFEAVTKWKNDLDSKVTLPDGSSIPTVLLANKCDQPKEGLVTNAAKMDDFCKDQRFVGWFETSAKENINIDQASKFLISRILNNEKDGLMALENSDKEKISIEKDDKVFSAKTKCSC